MLDLMVLASAVYKITGFIIFPEIPAPVDTILVGFSAAFMLLAFVVYMNVYIIMLVDLKKEKKAQEQAENSDSN